MKVLITGCTGFIGRKVAGKLTGKHEVIGVTRQTDPGFRGIEMDLSDEAAVAVYLEKTPVPVCDVMVHLAAAVASPGTVHDLSILNRNAAIAKSAAALARKAQVKKLVHISSMAVYPNINGTFSESSPADPSVNNDCIYGLSKFNEEVLLRFFLKGPGVTISHLRLAIVYGEGRNESRIVPVMEKELKEKGTVTVFGDGQRLLNLIEVNKTAEIIERFVEKDYPGVYNIGDECISMEDLALSLSKGDKSRVKKVPEGNRTRFILDISKLKSLPADV